MTGSATRGCAGCCTSPPRCPVRARSWRPAARRCRTARKPLGPAPWLPTSRAPPPTRSCTGWSRSIWRPSSPRPPRAPTGSACPASSSASSAASSAAGCSSMAFCGSGATTARSSASCRCPAKAARSAPVAAGGAWRSRRRISSRRSCPGCPVRQWVLTVPHRLRYRLAFDHALCRAVIAVFVRAVLGWYRRRARRAGWADGHSGSVTVDPTVWPGLQLM